MLLTTFLEAPLHDAAAVLVGADLYAMSDACLEDKVSEELKALAAF